MTDTVQHADIYTCPTCGVICDVCGCPPEPPPERAILLDLIAELRKLHRPYPDLDGELRLCNEGCVGTTPCLTYRYADRAEKRLRELDTPPNQI